MAGLDSQGEVQQPATTTAPTRGELPPALRTASRSRATLGLSNLTTRSSSASRIYTPEQYYAPLVSPVWSGAVSATSKLDDDLGPDAPDSQAYRAWQREARARALRSKGKRRSVDSHGEATCSDRQHRGPDVVDGRRKVSKGRCKDKAVAFVVGISSSGDEGDVEAEPDQEGRSSPSGRAGEGPFGQFFEGDAMVPREPGVDEIIRAQLRRPVQSVDPQDLDSLLTLGIADYSYVVPASPSRRSSLAGSSSGEGSRDSPEGDDLPQRVVLGKGKFSEVLLVRKDGVVYALKHTALHPHHQLISTRLLREPTILAQLLPHRNLVKVFETIRTPGHFYLVEECLRSSATLEDLVASSPNGVLPLDQAWSVLEQLASVVQSLHEPLRVCHRDIKPENILIRVEPPPLADSSAVDATLHLKLLDFGLATHFSASEPKLTTCCGSPAYHSPELWRGLRDRFGSVRYWGPEIDAWCVGLTVLRCVTPNKYPLGIGHTSLQSLADKVVDALLVVPDAAIRQVLAGLLHLDGIKRMKAFNRFCASLPERLARRAHKEGRTVKETTGQAAPLQREKKEFKTTAFTPSPLAHRLELFLDEQSYARSEGPKLEATIVDDLDGLMEQASSLATVTPARASRSTSSTRTATVETSLERGQTMLASGLPRAASGSPEAPASPPRRPSLSSSPDSPFSSTLTASTPSSDSLASTSSTAPPTPSSYSMPFHHPSYPPPIELVLLNPTDEPIRRAVSYIKYALRCKGILYHVREDTPFPPFSSTSPFTGAEPTSTGFLSPDFAPPTLPPTPYSQPSAPFGAFPFPSSPTTAPADESFICYLQCVVALPPSSASDHSPLSPATSRLRATLQQQHERTQQRRRPGMPARANTHTGHTVERGRSASTPPLRHSNLDRGDNGSPGGRKNSAVPAKVEALTFFLSIRKPEATDAGQSASSIARKRATRRRNGAARNSGPKARADAAEEALRDVAYASRIVVTLSDDRALPLVRDALALTDGADRAPTGTDAERRGRERNVGQATTPHTGPSDHSGSRDARIRRREVAAQVKRDELRGTSARDGGGVSTGLGMAMGPPADDSQNESGGGAGVGARWGDFSLGSLVGRLVGVGGGARGSRSSSRGPQPAPDGDEQPRRTRARSTLRT